jgi:membrane fusion protein
MSASTQPLFRLESLNSRNTAWLGRPAIESALPVTASAAASLVLAAALAALIAFGTYTRRVDLTGVMLPQSGLVTASAPTSGWVRRLAVREGQAVHEGDLLFTLDIDTTIKQGGVQQTIIDELTTQRGILIDEIQHKQAMAVVTAKQVAQAIANLKDQLNQLADQIDMQGNFEARLRDEYLTFLALYQKHNLPAAEMDARQQSWMAAQSTLQELKSNHLRLESQLINTEAQAAANPITLQNDIDDLRSKISAIDQSLANSEGRRAIEIRAPSAGVVTAITAQPGQVVSTGVRLLTIVPQNDTMIGQLLAPSTAVGFIRPGERVLLRYSGFPYQKFGQYEGMVESISRAALRDDEVQQWLPANAAVTQRGPYYRVTVMPDRQSVTAFEAQQRIPSNMQVDAYVLLDKRPLYQWILEPVYSIRRAWQSR